MSDDRWRDANAYAYQNDLSLDGMAWEFLRRNADYRAEFNAAADRSAPGPSRVAEPTPSAGWGLSVFADPRLSANHQPIFWRPHVSPRTIMLSPAAVADAGTLTFDPATWPGQFEQRDAPDGVHFLLRVGADEYRLWAAAPLKVGQRLAVVQPLDAHLAVRAEAACRFFWRLSTPAASPARASLGPLGRRVVRMLRALDGRAAGTSQRQIAEVVLGASCASPRVWEDCAARAATARLLRCGSAWRAGGYLKLLGRGCGR